jgi:LuxR family maltose regulon positive regulatory protein
LAVYNVRGLLEQAHGQHTAAIASFRAAARLSGRLTAPHFLAPRSHALLLHALVRLGQTDHAEQELADFTDAIRDSAEVTIALADLRLAQGNPHAAAAALAPVLDGTTPVAWSSWLTEAFLMEAITREALGDENAAAEALERALDQAEPEGAVLSFLLHPVPGLLERHSRHRTSHAALITEILTLLSVRKPAPGVAALRSPTEPLSDREIRVLRYLPTNLTAPEIARELSVSQHTVKTHMRNLYAKLDTHRRAETVARARELGLLAPSTLRR